MYTYHRDFSTPSSTQIFVFGSNEAGIHGAGAAKKAIEYGAKYGHGIGLIGRTYAIPTKDKKIKILNIETISRYIHDFIIFTHQRPELEFFVTRIGCGLAGYKDYEIAPLFNGCYVNCCFPSEWKLFIK